MLPVPDALHIAVLDTHIWLEWLLWCSPRLEPLRVKHAAGLLTLFASSETAAEWRRVLGYAQFAQTPEQIDALCVAFAQLNQCGALMPEVERVKLPKCRDLDDQKFLELSVVSGAKWLLTRDKKLRKIGKHKYFKALGLRVLPLEEYLAMFGTAEVASKDC
jgi:predicted nucleic acid-binding protein